MAQDNALRATSKVGAVAVGIIGGLVVLWNGEYAPFPIAIVLAITAGFASLNSP